MFSDAMNTEVHETTKATPYELVLGQRPQTSLFPSEQTPSMVTEELEEDGLQCDMDPGSPPPTPLRTRWTLWTLLHPLPPSLKQALSERAFSKQALSGRDGLSCTPYPASLK